MAYAQDIDQEISRWYAVVTGSRHEKYVVEQLQKKGIEAWTPLLKKTRIYKSKIRKVEIPLISRYIFVNITRENYVPVLEERLVLGFLHNQGRIYPVKDDEIRILRKISGEEVEAFATAEEIEKGDKVQIIYGELTGLQGEVVNFKGKRYIGIVLETLGMNMLIDVPIEALHKIKDI